MTKDEALKLALEALQFNGNIWHMDCKKDVAIAAIKEALAQPEQEPFTYYDPVRDAIRPFRSEGDIPLYTTPPQRPWVDLTDDDCKGMSAGDRVVAMWANRILKEKNT